jgi:hypothetical protein
MGYLLPFLFPFVIVALLMVAAVQKRNQMRK